MSCDCKDPIFDEIIGGETAYTPPLEELGNNDAFALQVITQVIVSSPTASLNVSLEASNNGANWVEHSTLISTDLTASRQTSLFGQSVVGNWQDYGRLVFEPVGGLVARCVAYLHPKRDGQNHFTPLALPGLKAVYDARYNASAAQWDDMSGNGNHLTQSYAPQQTTFLSDAGDGAPAFNFNMAGEPDWFYAPPHPELSSTEYTAYVLYQPQTGSSGVYLLWGQGVNGSSLPVNYIIHVNDVAGTSGYLLTCHRDSIPVQTEFSTPTTIDNTTWNVAVLRRDGINFTLRASSHNTSASASTYNPAAFTADRARVGMNAQYAGVGVPFDGKMRHVGLFSVAHTDVQIDEYINYLRRQYPNIGT